MPHRFIFTAFIFSKGKRRRKDSSMIRFESTPTCSFLEQRTPIISNRPGKRFATNLRETHFNLPLHFFQLVFFLSTLKIIDVRRKIVPRIRAAKRLISFE